MLSGWYRLGSAAPNAALWPNIRRAAALFGPHMVWGSDWPHTSFEVDCMPAYESTQAPARASLDAAGWRALLHEQACALYA
jgi:predicted TIM-barrel fold metal-dependent hydrolase